MITLELLSKYLFVNKMYSFKLRWAFSQVEKSAYTFAKSLPSHTKMLFLELELKIETLVIVTKLKLAMTLRDISIVNLAHLFQKKRFNDQIS